MLGRPGICDPVSRNVTAGSWLIASVCIDLMKQMSSTRFARCGSSSLTHAPQSPWRANENGDAMTGRLFCPATKPVSRCFPRTEGGSALP